MNPELLQPQGGKANSEEYQAFRDKQHRIGHEASHLHASHAFKHRSAIESYSWCSTPLNHHLINRPRSVKRNSGAAVRTLDTVHSKLVNAVNTAPDTHADFDLFSGISDSHVRSLSRFKEGDTVTSKAWLSTSFNPSVAGKFAGTRQGSSTGLGKLKKTILHVHVPAGSKGVFTIMNQSQHVAEMESLIKPGMKLRINKIHDHPELEHRVISAELVNENR